MSDLTFTYSRLGTFGALGNQLWEIASTVGIANKLQAQSRFPKWAYQPYFNIPENLFLDQLPLECDLSGNYLQDHRYHSDIFNTIRRWFGPSEISAERIDFEFPDLDQYTAVHVRRANNLSLPDHHPVQPLSYYEEALDTLGNPKDIVVFSDDLDWCRQQSIFADAFFGMENDKSISVFDLTGAAPVSLDTVAIDLLAMAKCQSFVISNSTFSWWSAYLADASNIIYPTNWYGPMVSADYSLMIGKDWGWTGI